MITLPKLNEKDMEIFKGKKVVLYTGDKFCFPTEIFKIFKSFKIEVLGASMLYEPSKEILFKARLQGLVYIKNKDLKELSKTQEDLIVQIVDFEPKRIEKIRCEIEALQIGCSQLDSGLIVTSFNYIVMMQKLRNPFWGYYYKIRKMNLGNNISEVGFSESLTDMLQSPIFICAPQKTGDFTLMGTFDESNKNNKEKIEYINVWHNPMRINKKKLGKKLGEIKIIMGIREPISTNISQLFQRISFGNFAFETIYNEITLGKKAEKKHILNKYEQMLINGGNDVQVLWNIYIGMYIKGNRIDCTQGYIQYFIQLFKKNVLDIIAYPFNKEKGYTIIKEGNMDIFIYQLEKLNNLVPELSEWVGTPFTELARGNTASDKWIADSYKQALQEIEITQEYFDRCFNEPYVQHCYSQEDIEKFKARWRPHIKKED